MPYNLLSFLFLPIREILLLFVPVQGGGMEITMNKITKIVLGIILAAQMCNIGAYAERPVSSVVHGFETAGQWMAAPSNEGGQSFNLTGSVCHSGQRSMQINYAFPDTAAGGSMGILPIDWRAGMALPGTPRYFGIWVYGDAGMNYLSVALRDSTGEMLSYAVDNIDWTGWKHVVFDISKPQGWYGGSPSNGVADMPVVLYSITTGTTPKTISYSGSVYYDDIAVSSTPFDSEDDDSKQEDILAVKETNTPAHLQTDNKATISPYFSDAAGDGRIGVYFDDENSVADISESSEGFPGDAVYAIDGSSGTYYRSEAFSSPDQMVELNVDLGEAKSIDEIYIESAKDGTGCPEVYSVSISNNGEDWAAVAENAKGVPGKIRYKFEQTLVRFIKIDVSRLSQVSDGGYELRIAEIEAKNYYVDVNYAHKNNGGTITSTSQRGKTIPKGYSDFFENINDLGRLYLRGGNYSDADNLIENVKKVERVTVEASDDKTAETLKGICDFAYNGAEQGGNTVQIGGIPFEIEDGLAETGEYSRAKEILKKQLDYIKSNKNVLWSSGLLFDDELRKNICGSAVGIMAKELSGAQLAETYGVTFSKSVNSAVLKNGDDIYVIYCGNGENELADVSVSTPVDSAVIIDPFCSVKHDLSFENDKTTAAVRNIAVLDYPLIIKINVSDISGLSQAARDRLASSVVMKTGTNRSIANGKVVNMNAPVIFENNKLWLPLRYIAENSGASVDWNSSLYLTKITGSDFELKYVSGSNLVLMNNTAVYTDDLPEIKPNGVQYMSAEFAEKIFGNYAYRDESGLVIVSRQKYIFNTANDAAIIAEILSMFN